MTRLDRYIFGQLVPALGFFLLVFTGVVWLTQAVRLIDRVIASGQSALVFLEFSALVLPQVFVIVLPLSGIGAALYTINRLYGDSELIVMMAAGLGPLALLRPVALFGAAIGGLTAVVIMALVPVSGAALAERTEAIRSDLANALIVERQFLHPASGLTLFISDTSTDGEMSGIFINDQRDFARPVTYSAERALLLRDGMEVRLVMQDGVALSPVEGQQRLNTVQFDQFVFDLSDLVRANDQRTPRPSEYAVTRLVAPDAEMLATGRYGRGDFVSEGHYKIMMPLLAAVFPMIALVTLLAGGYRRSGFGRRVMVAIGVSMVLQILMFVAREQVERAPALWPLIYLPLALAGLYIWALVRWLSRTASPRGPVPA